MEVVHPNMALGQLFNELEMRLEGACQLAPFDRSELEQARDMRAMLEALRLGPTSRWKYAPVRLPVSWPRWPAHVGDVVQVLTGTRTIQLHGLQVVVREYHYLEYLGARLARTGGCEPFYSYHRRPEPTYEVRI